MLEYDNQKGFRCQRCSSWTRDGNLYSGGDGTRICYLCHIDDVSGEMARRYSSLSEIPLQPVPIDPEMEIEMGQAMPYLDDGPNRTRRRGIDRLAR